MCVVAWGSEVSGFRLTFMIFAIVTIGMISIVGVQAGWQGSLPASPAFAGPDAGKPLNAAIEPKAHPKAG